jgi:hypothetical protein
VLHRSSKAKVFICKFGLFRFYAELFLLEKGHLLFKFSTGTEFTEAGVEFTTSPSLDSSLQLPPLLVLQQKGNYF